MTRRKPTQQRSRMRVDQILNAAEEELGLLDAAEKLSTTKVSRRAGVPVSSIYQYFTDRWAIVGALMARKIDQTDQEIRDALERSETVSIESLARLIVGTYYEYFKRNRRAVTLWFGTRTSDVVQDFVADHYRAMGEWLIDSATAAGLVENVPDWGGEALVWIIDRTFELALAHGRPRSESDAMMREGLEMIERQLHKYATEAGRDGIPTSEFLELAGRYPSEA